MAKRTRTQWFTVSFRVRIRTDLRERGLMASDVTEQLRYQAPRDDLESSFEESFGDWLGTGGLTVPRVRVSEPKVTRERTKSVDRFPDGSPIKPGVVYTLRDP